MSSIQKSARHVGGSILPSNSAAILVEMSTPHGALQVRVLPDEDTHGLYAVEGGVLLAKHPNGFSCRVLAERVRDGKDAAEQADYIVRCGGTVTGAGRALIAKASGGAV